MDTIKNPAEKLNFDNIWLMFQEIGERFKETDKKFQDTDKKFLDTDKKFKDTDKKFKDTNKKFQNTERLLNEKFLDTERLLSTRAKETSDEIKRLANLFTTQWGKLIEALVEPSCVTLFQERGIEIEQSMQNVKGKHAGRDMECDIILVNDNELVVIEVKTTFKPEYVDSFVERLKEFALFFPQFKNYKIYGATASLKYEAHSDKYAYRSGLFVLKSTGEGIIHIANDLNFKPVEY